MRIDHRLLPVAACVAVAATAAASPAPAQSHADLTTPTAWTVEAGVPASTISQREAQGYRVVDLEIDIDSPNRMSAVFVRNTGAYAKTSSWNVGLTEAAVDAQLASTNNRLVDIERYSTPLGVRYAALMVDNWGQDFASAHGWEAELTTTELYAWQLANPTRRVIDIEPFYASNGNQRYALAWVENSGQMEADTLLYINESYSAIQWRLESQGARLIDLEVHDRGDTFSAIMVRNGGDGSQWRLDLKSDEIERVAREYASRAIDIQAYRTSSGLVRYSMVTGRNTDSDLAVRVAGWARSELRSSASMGFLLRELGPNPVTLAAVQETEPFEASSVITTMHQFAALRQVAQGHVTLDAPVIEYTGTVGDCPTGSNPVVSRLDFQLWPMLAGQSTSTHAIENRFGRSAILAEAASYGATNTSINHDIGCFCGSARNQTTLLDLASIHDAVDAGALGSFQEEFYSQMGTGWLFQEWGGYSEEGLFQEAFDGLWLSQAARISFNTRTTLSVIRGSYSCVPNEHHCCMLVHASIPERNGCATTMRNYLAVAWVNDGKNKLRTEDAVMRAVLNLLLDPLRSAAQSWASANCDAFVTYCTAEPNSTGSAAQIGKAGSSWIWSNDLRITAAGMPAGAPSVLHYGTQQAFVPGGWDTAGNLCIGGNTQRLATTYGPASSNGRRSHDVVYSNLKGAFDGVSYIQPGQTLHFQWWYEDLGGPEPSANFTNALQVTFL